MDEPSAIIVFMTAPSPDKANEIAHALVNEKLAACATIIPRVQSLYWWEGKINRDEEVLIIAKSQHTLFPEIMQRVKSLHSYEVPEIISLPIIDGLPAYLDWLKNVIKKTL